MSDPLMKAVGDCFSEIAKLGQQSIDYYKQECERLQAENQSLRSQIVEWKPGGARGAVAPDNIDSPLNAERFETFIFFLGRSAFEGMLVSESDEREAGFDSQGIFIPWRRVECYLPLSDFPLPK